MLIELQDGGNIATSVAVVRRGPHGDQRIAEHPLVSLHHQLMRTADQVQPIHCVELRGTNNGETENTRWVTQLAAPSQRCPHRTGSQLPLGSGPSRQYPLDQTT